MRLSPEMIGAVVRSAWTETETFGARSYVQRHTPNDLLPIRGRKVYVSRAHIEHAWTVADIPWSSDLSTYAWATIGGRQN